MPTDALEGFRQGLFLASILAGFAITAVIELVSLAREHRLASYAMGAFIIAAGLFLITTVAFTFMISASVGVAGSVIAITLISLQSLGALVGNMVMLGVIALLAGIALTAWLHSKVMGILATIVMSLSAIAIFSIIIYIATLSP